VIQPTPSHRSDYLDAIYNDHALHSLEIHAAAESSPLQPDEPLVLLSHEDTPLPVEEPRLLEPRYHTAPQGQGASDHSQRLHGELGRSQPGFQGGLQPRFGLPDFGRFHEGSPPPLVPMHVPTKNDVPLQQLQDALPGAIGCTPEKEQTPSTELSIQTSTPQQPAIDSLRKRFQIHQPSSQPQQMRDLGVEPRSTLAAEEKWHHVGNEQVGWVDSHDDEDSGPALQFAPLQQGGVGAHGTSRKPQTPGAQALQRYVAYS
jgi:hypothetical protein